MSSQVRGSEVAAFQRWTEHVSSLVETAAIIFGRLQGTEGTDSQVKDEKRASEAMEFYESLLPDLQKKFDSTIADQA